MGDGRANDAEGRESELVTGRRIEKHLRRELGQVGEMGIEGTPRRQGSRGRHVSHSASRRRQQRDSSGQRWRHKRPRSPKEPVVSTWTARPSPVHPAHFLLRDQCRQGTRRCGNARASRGPWSSPRRLRRSERGGRARPSPPRHTRSVRARRGRPLRRSARRRRRGAHRPRRVARPRDRRAMRCRDGDRRRTRRHARALGPRGGEAASRIVHAGGVARRPRGRCLPAPRAEGPPLRRGARGSD